MYCDIRTNRNNKIPQELVENLAKSKYLPNTPGFQSEKLSEYKNKMIQKDSSQTTQISGKVWFQAA